jgi:WD40 repeat protein
MDAQETGPERCRLLAVAVGTYREEKRYPRLDKAVAIATELADVFVRAGFLHDHPELVGEHVLVGTIDSVVTAWWKGLRCGDHAVAYWTGHGIRSSRSHLLLAGTDSPADPAGHAEAVNPEELFEQLIRSPAQVGLMILDTCYSGMFGIIAEKVMAKTRAGTDPSPNIVGKRIGVLTTSHPAKMVTSPVVGAALARVLANPDTGSASWGRRDEKIDLGELRKALNAEIGSAAKAHVDWHAWRAESTGWATDDGRDWLPNPAYLDLRLDEVVELQRELLAFTKASEHLDRSHRGLEVGSSGWAFVGRVSTLNAINDWLKSASEGVLIVTGPPGSGKSAVVGRMVTLSIAPYRAHALRAGVLAEVPPSTLPEAGAFDAAVHAREKSLLAVLSQLAEAFGLDLGESTKGMDTEAAMEALRSHLRRLGQERRRTIAIDAVDEARAGHGRAIGQACRDLGEIPGVRVLVGVRYSVSGAPVREGTDPSARLRQHWPAAIIVDLNDDPCTQADMERYVERRLAGRHQDGSQRRSVAKAVAEKAVSAQGYFLYARIVSRTLEEATTLPGPGELPSKATDAFAADLLDRFGADRDRFDDLLGALAWAFGSGLPKTVWPKVAETVLGLGAVYETSDINDLLDRAGSHVVESEENGQSVYRLAHELLNEYYRNRHRRHPAGMSHAEIHRRIAETLIQAVPGSKVGGKDWDAAPPYVRTHLVGHAAESGLLDTLLDDERFVLAAEPEHLLRHLHLARKSASRSNAQCYRRVAHHLPSASRLVRAQFLLLSAQQCGARDFADRLRSLATGCRWNTLNTWFKKPVANRVIATLACGPDASCLEADRPGAPRLHVAVGKAAHVFDLETGEEVDRLVLPAEPIVGLKVIADAHKRWMVAADKAGTITVIDLDTGETIGARRNAHLQIKSLGIVQGEGEEPPFVCSGDADGALRVHALPDLRLIKVIERAHKARIDSIGPIRVAGRSLIVTCGFSFRKGRRVESAQVRFWDCADWSLVREFRGTEGSDARWFASVHLADRLCLLVCDQPFGPLQLFDAATAEALSEPVELKEPVFACVARGDGTMTYNGDSSSFSRTWILENPRSSPMPYRLVSSASARVRAGDSWHGPVELRSGQAAVSCSSQIRVWNVEELIQETDDARELKVGQVDKDGEPLFALATESNGTHFCGLSRLGNFRAWNLDGECLLLRQILTNLDHVADAFTHLQMLHIDGEAQIIGATKRGEIQRFRLDGSASCSPVSTGGRIDALACASSDGRPLAFVGVVVRDPDSSRERYSVVRIWDLADGTEVDSRFAFDPILHEFDPRSQWAFGIEASEHKGIARICVGATSEHQVMAAVSGPSHHRVTAWDWRTKERLWARSMRDVANTLIASSEHILGGDASGRIYCWNASTGKEIQILVPSQAAVAGMALVRVGVRNLLVSAHFNGELFVWSESFEPIDRFDVGDRVTDIVALQDQRIVVATERGFILIRLSQ